MLMLSTYMCVGGRKIIQATGPCLDFLIGCTREEWGVTSKRNKCNGNAILEMKVWKGPQ